MARITRSTAKTLARMPTATATSPSIPTVAMSSSIPSTPSSGPSPSSTSTSSSPSLPTLLFETAAAFDAWLSENHATSPGLLMKIAKKGAPEPSITYDEAVDTALCHGWIDGQRNALSEHHFIQRFTRRRKKSVWSRRNVEKVAALTKAGRMRPAGQQQVDAAKADGRWDSAYAGQRSITVPEDLRVALEATPSAQQYFGGLNKTLRYRVLVRIEMAKTPGTRKKLVRRYVEILGQGRTP
ncbi:hypothetical protein SODALDRAFT_326200 [Sodiomyces alkalinus F11]|uniref:Bacteriocin-protection protein, YdeI/OmpD-associated family n=1 Tax=Sodiomyces alkalinus (strain CBS 110278 / VKM F-3762 / F11) TaxID=1314773 RepID=A0A3N2Q5I8_SODAK|nr:hypothetical protein SODALDRAFT_326200 [Sodiomyces alkalinus F11]ROT42039.1 hypothetical protein SODALDRAFT_326200 [Sodiomyces alkalinus F11]